MRNLNPTSSRHVRQAAEVAKNWPLMSRRARRAGVRWWWRSCVRTADTFQRQWQAINGAHGIVEIEQ